jgi:SAM-dependent methyltransferase
MHLNELGLKYGTDKSSDKHDYLDFYEELFDSMNIENFLELGIFRFRSLPMWLEYFEGCYTTVYGVDLEKRYVELAKKNQSPNLVVDRLDCSNKEDMESYAKSKGVEFDVIIDDASHITSHQMAAFEALWPYVAPGGCYIVEDTHCSHNARWRDTPETIAEYFAAMLPHITKKKSKTVLSIHFHQNLIVVRKK